MCRCLLLVDLTPVNRVVFPDNIGIINFPSTSRENVFVLLIPASLDDFSGVRLVFLNAGIRDDPHVIVHIEVKQGSCGLRHKRWDM